MALTKVTGQVIKNTTDVTVGVLTVTNTLAVGGTVSIGGTLTYEDVTNVDAVGLITARNGIVVGSGITLSKDGDGFFTGIVTATSYAGDGSGLTGVGIATESASISGITTYLNLSKDDHELVVTGTNTISVIGGAQGTSHTLRLQNSGIATITLDSTYFKFASGATPALPTADGSISLVSFTVHKAGAVGVNTVLLSGASVSFS